MSDLQSLILFLTMFAVAFESKMLRKTIFIAMLLVMAPQAFCWEDMPRYRPGGEVECGHHSCDEPTQYEEPRFASYEHRSYVGGEPIGGYSEPIGGHYGRLGRSDD